MAQPGDPERNDRRRRPIPWPLHVGITALATAVLAVLAVLYVLFGSASEDLRRFAVSLGYEDSYVRHCKVALPYYLKTYEARQLVQSDYLPDPDPHDVRLAYDAQDTSGELVRGEFRCLFRKGSANSSDFGPRLNDVEVNGKKLPVDQIVWINLFGPMESRQGR